jgi:hypothetical protein
MPGYIARLSLKIIIIIINFEKYPDLYEQILKMKQSQQYTTGGIRRYNGDSLIVDSTLIPLFPMIHQVS